MSRFMHRIFSLCCASVAAMSCPAEDLPRSVAIEAVWKPQIAPFTYRSEGRRYSCDVLAYKIRLTLSRLGANGHVDVRRIACHDLATLAHFEVALESPIEATMDNVRAVTTHDATSELIARVQGTTLATPENVQRFPATWRTVSFRHARRLDLDAGDCALVQQLRNQLLPKMSIRILRDIRGVDCSEELSGIRKPDLTVVALVPTDELL